MVMKAYLAAKKEVFSRPAQNFLSLARSQRQFETVNTSQQMEQALQQTGWR